MNDKLRQRLGQMLLAASAVAIIVVLSQTALSTRAQSSAAIIRVSLTYGNDNAQDCGEVATPCQSIQKAVNRLKHFGNTGSILVAEGIYYHPANIINNDCQDYGITVAVVCIPGYTVTLLGGYPDDSSWSNPDPVTHPTIIDGQNQYRGVLILNGILYMDGFTIQNGLAQGATSGTDFKIDAYGGGMQSTTSSVVLRHIVFKNNQARGGNTSTSAGGTAVGAGLSMNNYSGAPIFSLLENVTFDHNQGFGGTGPDRGGNAIGGGFHSYNSNVSGQNITFTNNVVTSGASNGNGMDTVYHIFADAQGGAAAIYLESNAMFQHVTAIGNQAIGGYSPNGDGGGAYGGAFYSEQAVFGLTDALIRDNVAQGGNGLNNRVTIGAGLAQGGGLQTNDVDITLQRVSVIANIAKGGNGTNGTSGVAGGGIALTHFQPGYGQAQITNAVVADNQVQLGSGPNSPFTGGGGGGIWVQGVNVDIVHTTIARNFISSGLYGQALIAIGSQVGYPASIANLSYSIIADHTNSSGMAAIEVQSGATVNLNAGLWSGNSLNFHSSGTFTAVGMLIGSAQFASPGGPNYNYHILGNSAARDQAVSSTVALDIDGEDRSLFLPRDIGADEYEPIKLAVRPTASRALKLSWATIATLAPSVDHYTVVFTKDSGAQNPSEGISPYNAGLVNSLILTGLTNDKHYTFTIQARDLSNTLLDSSNTVAAILVDTFVYLPLVLR
jgi:hypothetical protein